MATQNPHEPYERKQIECCRSDKNVWLCKQKIRLLLLSLKILSLYYATKHSIAYPFKKDFLTFEQIVYAKR